MPLYDYHCPACSRDFELLVLGGDVPECPGCKSRKVERRMSVPARSGSASASPDFSRLGPPAGGCCGGSCHGHTH